MDLFISLSRGDIFATKEVHFDLSGLLCHLRNGFKNTRDQQNHLETSWYFEKSLNGSEFLMMMKMLEVLMLLMMVINLQECLFRNRKHCCFCVCSNYRVDVRMSAASGGKFCVNIFCFRDPPPTTLCGLYISLPSHKKHVASRFKFNNTVLRVQHIFLALDTISDINHCC